MILKFDSGLNSFINGKDDFGNLRHKDSYEITVRKDQIGTLLSFCPMQVSIPSPSGITQSYKIWFVLVDGIVHGVWSGGNARNSPWDDGWCHFLDDSDT